MLKKLLSRFTDLLFPRRCPVCGDVVLPQGHLICPECFKKLSFVRQPTCRRCGAELSSDTVEYCYDCTKNHRTFEYGMALLNYDEVSAPSMVKIKYKNKREYLDFYGQAILVRFASQIRAMNPDCIVPIPIHSSRRRIRGFNQAEVLAKILSRGLISQSDTSSRFPLKSMAYSAPSDSMTIPVYPKLLIRNKKTIPQKQLSPAERLKNLEQAFSIGKIPPGIKSVLLIDDIYTTGATIEACTRVLKKAGIEKVYFISICIGGKQ